MFKLNAGLQANGTKNPLTLQPRVRRGCWRAAAAVWAADECSSTALSYTV